MDLNDLFARLYRSGVTSVLVEGGAALAWGALEARAVDRCMFFYAPVIIGGQDAPCGIGGLGVSRLSEAPRLMDMEVARVGPDILVNGRVLYPADDEAGRGQTSPLNLHAPFLHRRTSGESTVS